jgi:hypothetical protein
LSANTSLAVVGECNVGQVYCLGQIVNDLGDFLSLLNLLLLEYSHTQVFQLRLSYTSTAIRKLQMIGLHATDANAYRSHCRIVGSRDLQRGEVFSSAAQRETILGLEGVRRGTCVLRDSVGEAGSV